MNIKTLLVRITLHVTIAAFTLSAMGEGKIYAASNMSAAHRAQTAYHTDAFFPTFSLISYNVRTMSAKNKFIVFVFCAFSVASLAVNSVIGAGAADTDVSNAYAYPVPYKPSMGHRSITFTLLPTQGTIKVYTVNGELVREIGFSSPVDSKVVWDARNAAGEDLGSDVYVYIITSGDNKKTGKLMVVR